MKTDLDLLNDQLQIELNSLKNELQECLAEEDYKYARYYNDGILLTKRKIKTLLSMRHEYMLDSQYLADALVELSEGTIQSFSMFFLAGSDFYLRFDKLTGKELLCRLPGETEMSRAHYYVYSPVYQRQKIMALGFKIYENEPVLKFQLEDNHSCNEILTKLSILMFDILNISKDAKGYITKKSF
jgi:hypothetical protein